jgi:hypothetical protein
MKISLSCLARHFGTVKNQRSCDILRVPQKHNAETGTILGCTFCVSSFHCQFFLLKHCRFFFLCMHLNHHHRPLIPLCEDGTTSFLLSSSSITRHLHAHSFYFHVILHTIHPSFPRPTRLPIYIHSHHSFCYVTFIPPHNMPIQANLLLPIFLNTGATFKLPLIY